VAERHLRDEHRARADKKSVIVGREVDGGVVKLKLTLPAVISVDLRIVAPKS
jgi:electron transfer flavoprotein beta subunit